MSFGLPSGLVLVCSMDRVQDSNRNGAAITRSTDSTQWYATDFYCPVGNDPETGAATFGPFSTLARARRELESTELEYLDSNGTDGTSTWLTLT